MKEPDYIEAEYMKQEMNYDRCESCSGYRCDDCEYNFNLTNGVQEVPKDDPLQP